MKNIWDRILSPYVALSFPLDAKGFKVFPFGDFNEEIIQKGFQKGIRKRENFLEPTVPMKGKESSQAARQGRFRQKSWQARGAAAAGCLRANFF